MGGRVRALSYITGGNVKSQFMNSIKNLNAYTIQPSNPTPGVLYYRNKGSSTKVYIFKNDYHSIILIKSKNAGSKSRVH